MTILILLTISSIIAFSFLGFLFGKSLARMNQGIESQIDRFILVAVPAIYVIVISITISLFI